MVITVGLRGHPCPQAYRRRLPCRLPRALPWALPRAGGPAFRQRGEGGGRRGTCGEDTDPRHQDGTTTAPPYAGKRGGGPRAAPQATPGGHQGHQTGTRWAPERHHGLRRSSGGAGPGRSLLATAVMATGAPARLGGATVRASHGASGPPRVPVKRVSQSPRPLAWARGSSERSGTQAVHRPARPPGHRGHHGGSSVRGGSMSAQVRRGACPARAPWATPREPGPGLRSASARSKLHDHNVQQRPPSHRQHHPQPAHQSPSHNQ